jgi:hypothetical protein
MGTILGVIIGYVLGTRAGEQGFEELREAWKVITSSEEVRDLVTGSLSMGRDLIVRAAGGLGSAEGRSTLRPVA